MTLWDWAVAAYERLGVSEACLTLQDAHDQNVPLLLWAAWTAAEGRPLDDRLAAHAAEAARAWDLAAVAPLRSMRRLLKAAHPPVEDAARLAFREQVKAVELNAERLLLDTLAAMASPPAEPAADPLAAMTRAAAAWAPEPPLAALADLAERLRP